AADRFSVGEWVTNNYAFAVAIAVEREVTNLTPGQVATGAVVPPHGVVRIGSWEITDRELQWRERSELTTAYGAPTAQPIAYVYALPFTAGESHQLIQSFNSAFSHTGDNAYAVDFDMPEGRRYAPHATASWSRSTTRRPTTASTSRFDIAS